jgi:hypothetical protein
VDYVAAPVWSPDGETIVVDWITPNRHALLSVPAKTGEVKELAELHKEIGGIVWPARAGGLLVLMDEAKSDQANFQIWHLGVPGGQWTRVTSGEWGFQWGSLSGSTDGTVLMAVRVSAPMNLWDSLWKMFSKDYPSWKDVKHDLLLMHVSH